MIYAAVALALLAISVLIHEAVWLRGVLADREACLAYYRNNDGKIPTELQTPPASDTMNSINQTTERKKPMNEPTDKQKRDELNEAGSLSDYLKQIAREAKKKASDD